MRRDGLHRAAVGRRRSAPASSPARSASSPAAAPRRRRAPARRAAPRLPFDAAHIRALMIGSAELGEIVMRAFILRRVALIEEGGAGSLLIGHPGTPDVVRLQGFLVAQRLSLYGAGRRRRRGSARVRWSVSACSRDELPLMICPNGSGAEAAERRRSRRMCLGITPELDPEHASTTSPWSAPVPPGLPPRSMARRKACR